MNPSTAQTDSQLAAQRLADDPRVAQAKQLLSEAMAEHQGELNAVRPPQPQFAASNQQLLDEFGKMRGGSLYFPYISSGLGNGPFVELMDGSVKLDLITGIGVHGLGHNHPALLAAGIDASLSDTVMQGNLQQGLCVVEFTDLLLKLANESGAGLDHCFLSTSGAMANENSLKVAFQKRHPANRVLAFKHCFAGRTLALAQVTDKASYRLGLPDTIRVDYLPFFDANRPAESTADTLRVLRDKLQRYPHQYACLWMELIQGEGGYYPGERDFFLKLIEEVKQQDVAVIADEVQTFGRTTRPFAFQHFGLDQQVDLVTIGKISQVCATLFRDEYKPKPGLLSQTFTGSSWAMMAGKATLQHLVDHKHFGPDGRNMQLFRHFESGLQAISGRYPQAVAGPHGLGGMVAFTPGDGSAQAAKFMVHRMYELGLMSFMAGSDPCRVRFLMPLGCVTTEHIDLALKIIEQAASEYSPQGSST